MHVKQGFLLNTMMHNSLLHFRERKEREKASCPPVSVPGENKGLLEVNRGEENTMPK
jgi:hypothetical protein